jgi:hypothetical protein
LRPKEMDGGVFLLQLNGQRVACLFNSAPPLPDAFFGGIGRKGAK